MRSGNADGPPLPARPVHYAWVVLGFVVLAVFSSLGLARFGYTAILPAMQDALALSNLQTGMLQSSNLLGYMLAVVFAGVLATRFGPRLVVSASLLLTGAAMLLTGWIPTFGGAQAGRFLAGVGGAGGNVPAMALVSAWFGPRRRGVATGIGVAGSSVGLMVTGPLIPRLLERHDWRVCWYVLGALAVATAALCLAFLRNRPADHGLLPLGDAPRDAARPNATRGASALDWGSVYRSRRLWHLAVVYFAFGFSYIIYSTFFIRYLSREGGFTLAGAGQLWFRIGLVSIVSGFLWGGVSDRWGRKLALFGVFLVQAIAFGILGVGHRVGTVYASAALFALTAWSIPALMAALAGDLFGARLAPAALGLMTIVFGLGQALGPFVAGKMADAAQSFAPAFLLAGAVALVLGGGGTLFLPGKEASAAPAQSPAG
ncbi:MAG: MFS transporter [Verrucomicrobia bacterium]|nr:MFS transporter [Verrucomicrobiota bacterium]